MIWGFLISGSVGFPHFKTCRCIFSAPFKLRLDPSTNSLVLVLRTRKTPIGTGVSLYCFFNSSRLFMILLSKTERTFYPLWILPVIPGIGRSGGGKGRLQLGPIGGKTAGGVGGRGVPGQKRGLAAAAAEVHLFEVAGRTRLGHPRGAPEAVERFAFVPNPVQVLLLHIFQLQGADRIGRGTGQHLPI